MIWKEKSLSHLALLHLEKVQNLGHHPLHLKENQGRELYPPTQQKRNQSKQQKMMKRLKGKVLNEKGHDHIHHRIKDEITTNLADTDRGVMIEKG